MEYAIGKVAELTKLPIYTLRYYEKIGLIKVKKDGKNRLYTDKDIDLLLYIVSLKNLGFSLDQVKVYTQLKAQADLSKKDREELLVKQLEETEEKLTELLKIREELTDKIKCIRGDI